MEINNILRKGLAIGIIILFIGAAITSSININVVKAFNNSDYAKITSQARQSDLIKSELITSTPLDGRMEVIDQQQESDCGWGVDVYTRHWEAQSFTPTLETLTKVTVHFFKTAYYVPSGINITVHIRATLTGDDLVSLSKNASVITQDATWVEFDFSDITVIPGNKYYIICENNGGTSLACYAWLFKKNNAYNGGEAWRSNDSGATWTLDEDPPDWIGLDCCFFTYGLDEPPNIPTITGSSWGAIGVEYNYNIHVIDPDADNIFCQWYWDDGYISDWLGPYSSGQIASASHTWTQKGIYEIRVKLKDQHGAESKWSEPFEMYINIDFSIEIQGGFGITATVKNIGDTEISNVQWTLTLTGGHVLLGKSKSGSISSLEPNATATFKDALILGFGKTTIDIEIAWAEEESVRKSATGTVFLFFVLGVK